MQLRHGKNPVLVLIRWLFVVLSGCIIGLAFVYVVVNFHYNRPRPHGLQAIHDAPKEPVAHFEVSEAAVEKELSSVIESQLSAFRKDDYPGAYEYAASDLRTKIPLPAFERMVKAAYPVIAQSDAIRFGLMVDNGEQALVNATVAGAGGRSFHYQYVLQREHFGWKISGVSEMKPSGTTL